MTGKFQISVGRVLSNIGIMEGSKKEKNIKLLPRCVIVDVYSNLWHKLLPTQPEDDQEDRGILGWTGLTGLPSFRTIALNFCTTDL